MQGPRSRQARACVFCLIAHAALAFLGASIFATIDVHSQCVVYCALWTPPQADGGAGHAPCGPFNATTLTLPAHPAEVKYMFQDGPTSPTPQLRSYALLRTRGARVISRAFSRLTSYLSVHVKLAEFTGFFTDSALLGIQTSLWLNVSQPEQMSRNPSFRRSGIIQFFQQFTLKNSHQTLRLHSFVRNFFVGFQI